MEHLEIVTGPSVTQSGTVASGSAVVTGLTTSALAGAVSVTGTGIPPGTFVLSVDSATQLTLTQQATATGAESLTFALEPITLAEAKTHLRVEIAEDDALIATLVSAARLRAQTLLRQTLLTTTYDYFLDYFPGGSGGYFNRSIRSQGPGPNWLPNGAAGIILPMGPLVSVVSLQYYDSSGTLTTFDPSAYLVSSGVGSRIQPLVGRMWPVLRPQYDGVVVRYVAGNATADKVTPNVKVAIKFMIGHWYEHREEVSDLQTYPVPSAVDALLSATDPGIYA